ncbi:MAG: TerD family protein, partial [Oscillospiraceae bacterium]
DDFVFFGNRDTVSGALVFNEDKSIEADLKKVPDHIKKISFVYSIYKPGPLDNFSKVKEPFVSVSQNNREILKYTATELFAETTIIFFEIYKHSSGWKINAIGQGYKEGLKRLCAGYGLIVS